MCGGQGELTQVVEDGVSKHDLRGTCCFQEGPEQGGALGVGWGGHPYDR